MGDGVLGPAVSRFQFDGAPTGGFGTAILPGLFEAKCVQAQDGVKVRHSFRPGGQGAGNAVAQHARVAGQEIHLLAGLQRQNVQRVGDGDILKDASRVLEFSNHDRIDRRDVSGLAWSHCETRRRGDSCSAEAANPGFGSDQRHIGDKHVSHDESGAVGQRRPQHRKGLASIAVVRFHRISIEAARDLAAACQFQSMAIPDRHLRPSNPCCLCASNIGRCRWPGFPFGVFRARRRPWLSLILML